MVTGQGACSTQCRPTEPSSALATPPRPRQHRRRGTAGSHDVDLNRRGVLPAVGERHLHNPLRLLPCIVDDLPRRRRNRHAVGRRPVLRQPDGGHDAQPRTSSSCVLQRVVEGGPRFAGAVKAHHHRACCVHVCPPSVAGPRGPVRTPRTARSSQPFRRMCHSSQSWYGVIGPPPRDPPPLAPPRVRRARRTRPSRQGAGPGPRHRNRSGSAHRAPHRPSLGPRAPTRPR